MKDENVYFRPRARLMLELGEQLIKNESVAMLELIKNSYDAFARNVNVRLDNIDDCDAGLIVIEDDGIGMTKETVVNHWMEPATFNKKKIVDNCKEAITHNGVKRIPLGEKGIGRFGAHKLGNHIKLVTRNEDDQTNREVYFEINWNDFNNDKYLNEVEVKVFEREPEVFVGDKHGTRIEITELRHNWQKREYRNVYKSMLSLNSPFKTDDSFKIHIKSTHEEWIKDLKDFADMKSKALYRAHIVLEGNKIVEYTYNFQPWEVLQKVKARESHDFQGAEILDLENKKKTGVNLAAFEIGKVTIDLSIFDLDGYVLNLGFPNEKNMLKDYLKQNGGISIYRDNMRLNEYGEQSNDWLGLGARRINNPAKTLSSNLVVGAVYIDRLDSKDLIEKTSREGFIENAAYNCFVKAVLYAISCVENDRMQDKADLRAFYSGNFKEPVIGSVRHLSEIVDKKVKDEDVKKEIKSALKNIENEYEEINKIYVKSSSLGLNMSMVIHEIDKILKELEKSAETEGVSSHITGLISDLAGRISSYSEIIKNTKMRSITLDSLIDGTQKILKYRLKAHNLSFERQIKDKDIAVICADSLVRSAIMNIVDNSIYWLERYKIQDKKICFMDYSEEPGFRGLLIVDNGKGFTLPTDKITLPFVSKKDDGMGLGLHLVSQIMETMGGKVLFPDINDFEISEEYKTGAAIALVFKEETKN